jgi:hypothetical protein
MAIPAQAEQRCQYIKRIYAEVRFDWTASGREIDRETSS